MERTEIVSLYKNTPADGTVVTVCGRQRTSATPRTSASSALSDGASSQIVLEAGKLATTMRSSTPVGVVRRIVLKPASWASMMRCRPQYSSLRVGPHRADLCRQGDPSS